MSHSITIDANIFKSEADRAYSQKAVLYLLEALVNINRLWLRTHPSTPGIYESGIRYIREYDTEDWRDVPTLIKDGGGDCEDLASYLCAELRERHKEKCRPYIRWRKYNQFYLYHVLVQRANGQMEDPSAKLGMYDKEE